MEDELLEDLKNYTKEDRIIYTSYHNPYKCDFGTPQITKVSPDGNTVVIESTGHGVRIYTNKKFKKTPKASSYMEEENYIFDALYNILDNNGFVPSYLAGLDVNGLLRVAKRFNLLTEEEANYEQEINNLRS